LAIAFEDSDEARSRKLQPGALARVRQQASLGVLADAGTDEELCRSLVEAIALRSEWPTREGRVVCRPTGALAALRGTPGVETAVVPAGAQGGNTTVRIGETLFLKICRRLAPGPNPEVEIGRYLTEVAHFPHCAPLAGFIEYRRGDGTSSTLALLEAFIANQGDGWDYTVNHLVRYLEERITRVAPPADAHGLHLALMKTLATRTAELHAALAASGGDPALAPEPISGDDLAAWYGATRAAAAATLETLSERASWEPQLDEWESQARRVFLATYDEIARGAGLYASFEEMAPLLALFELDAALGDLRRELASRPEWAEVPLRRLSALAP